MHWNPPRVARPAPTYPPTQPGSNRRGRVGSPAPFGEIHGGGLT